MVKLEHYWSTNKNWWHWTEDGEIVMNEAAPNDAKESYRIYKQQLADIDRRTGRWLVIPKDKTGWEYYEQYDLDWSKAEEGSYTNAYMTVIKIPYDEFIILEEYGIVDFIEDASLNDPVGRISQMDVKKCIEMISTYKDKVSVFYAGLLEAEGYGMEIEFVEANIKSIRGRFCD